MTMHVQFYVGEDTIEEATFSGLLRSNWTLSQGERVLQEAANFSDNDIKRLRALGDKAPKITHNARATALAWLKARRGD